MIKLTRELLDKYPEDIIEEIKKRPKRQEGAGFPTWKKWNATKNANVSAGGKFIICNGDEGNPRAYIDRSVLEGNPYCVLEG